MKTLRQRFDEKWIPEPNTGCHLWTAGTHKQGYGHFRVGKTILAHRVAWEIKNGPVPAGMCVCHKCDTPACVNEAHLFLGSQLQNLADRDAKGRTSRKSRNAGMDNPRTKIGPAEVRGIRFCLGLKKFSQAQIGKWYGIGTTQVHKIKHGTAWSHI